MPKVEDMSMWLHWAVDPTSALRVLLLPPLLTLPTHFLPAPPPVSPSLASRIGQPLHPILPPLPPHPRPGVPLVSSRAPRAGPRRPCAARLHRCPVLFLAARPEPQPFSGVGAEVGIRKAGKMARFGVLFGGGGLGGSESFSVVLSCDSWVCGMWCATRAAGRPSPPPFLSFPSFPLLFPSLLPPSSSLPVPPPAFLLFPPSFFLPHTHSINFRLNPCTPYPPPLPPPRPTSGSTAHNHLSGPMKRYYLRQIVYWLQQALAWRVADSRRVVLMRMLSTFWAPFVPGVFPDPNPMRVPTEQPIRWALFSSTLNRVP
ncbi:hypothetical protein B0H13DRAFT_2316832 [Mycena leptocephala]|nr:hypothetical protein B0H13DRAFT_2316832 [Mycena leptocephala]